MFLAAATYEVAQLADAVRALLDAPGRESSRVPRRLPVYPGMGFPTGQGVRARLEVLGNKLDGVLQLMGECHWGNSDGSIAGDFNCLEAKACVNNIALSGLDRGLLDI